MPTKPIIENTGTAAEHTPPRPDIQAAYQIHTLAHLLYGQLNGPPSWSATPYGQPPWQVHTTPTMPNPPFGYWPHL